MDDKEIAKMLGHEVEGAMLPVACQLWLAIYDHALAEGFCVSFDALWPILGYSKVGNAKRALSNGFIVGEDFMPREEKRDGTVVANFAKGRGKEHILLTVEAAQAFALSTRTPEAKAFSRLVAKVMRAVLQWQKSKVIHVASLTQAENRQLQIAKHELSVQGLIAKAYAFMGMPFEAEVQCGNRIADFIYRRFGAPVIVEVKKGSMTVADAECEHAKFLQKKACLPARWAVKTKPAEFLLLASGFEPEAIIAMRGRATCRTFGELRQQMHAKLEAKWADVNQNKLRQQQRQFDLIFNGLNSLLQ